MKQDNYRDTPLGMDAEEINISKIHSHYRILSSPLSP